MADKKYIVDLICKAAGSVKLECCDGYYYQFDEDDDGNFYEVIVDEVNRYVEIEEYIKNESGNHDSKTLYGFGY